MVGGGNGVCVGIGCYQTKGLLGSVSYTDQVSSLWNMEQPGPGI